MSENPIRRQLLQEILGPHDDSTRIRRLHAIGLSLRMISELTGRTQSHVSRLLDESVYQQHLKFNREWKARRRKPSSENTAGEEFPDSDSLNH